MGLELRLPNITAATTQEQLVQVKSYLFSLTEQLNWALKTLEGSGGTSNTSNVQIASKQGAEDSTNKNPTDTFNSIKSLIIKSADIIEAYTEEIEKKLSGIYVAQSDFGTYTKETEVKLATNSEGISALFENVQTIDSSVASINQVLTTDGSTTKILSTDAWVKIGAIATEETGHYLYGMEIGQTNEINGQTVETKFAQYTSEGVYLYDGNSSSWSVRIANNMMTINEVEVRTSLRQGGFKSITLSDGSVARKWIGVD